MGFINVLFKAILISSVLGSFVTIIVMLIKKLFKNKLSATWHYYIWILLILRLAIPYSYQSPLSIFNIFTNTFSNVQTSLNTASIKDSTTTQNNGNKDNTLLPKNPDTFTNNPMSVSKQTIKDNKASTLNLFNMVSIIWFIVMFSTLLFILISNMRFSKRLRNQEICKDKEMLDVLESCKEIINVKSYIPVVYASDLNGVSLYGIFNPKILISDKITDNFTAEQKKYIFLHELIHLKYKDILMNWIMLILVAFNWFNPVIWYSFYRMQQDCELACDEKVLSYIEPICYNNYSSTIIGMASLFSKSHNVFNSTALVSRKSNLKRRIGMINSFKSKSLKWSMVGLVLIALIGIVCLVNPKAAKNLVKKTTSASSINLNTNKPTVEIQQSENNSSTEVVGNNNYLSKLNFMLPKNWSIDKSQNFEYAIIDEKGERIGLIDPFDYVDNFDILTQKPNHSSVTKDEYVDIPLGKCRLITLDSDNGSAASGLTGTHDAYYAAIPIKGKAIYILNFTKNDKRAETKAQFIQILKGLSVKNDIKAFIDIKLDVICNNTKVAMSSNPYDYTKDSQDYKDIVNLGDSALKYMLTRFQNSKGNGLTEYVMAIACSEILKENTETKEWSTGREWYDNYENITLDNQNQIEPMYTDITLKTNSTDLQIISKQIMEKFFDEYKKDLVRKELRIKDYTINEINVLEKSSDKFSFSIRYSLKPAYINSYVLAGNGEIKGEWFVNKFVFVGVQKIGQEYKINSMGTGK